MPQFVEARVLGGEHGLAAVVEIVNVMQIPSDRFAGPGQLLLANASSFENDVDSLATLVGRLAERGVAGLAVRDTPGDRAVTDPSVIDAADDVGLPLLQLPRTSHLADLQASVLEQLVMRQSYELRASARARELLTGFALAAEPPDRLPDVVATLVDGPVWLLDARGGLLAASRGADASAIDDLRASWSIRPPAGLASYGDRFVVQPIGVGARLVGGLIAEVDGPVGPVPLAALQHAATVAGFQLAYRDSARELTMRYRSEALADLLTGRLSGSDAARRAREAGWDLDRAYRVVVVLPASLRESCWSLLERTAPRAIVADHLGLPLVLVADDAYAELAEALLGLDPAVRLGVSRAHPSINTLTEAVSEAEEAVRVAETFGRLRTREYQELGVLRFLASVPPADAVAFVDEVLAPLDAVDDEFRLALTETLERVIDANLNLAQAARAGGWHYNTLRYRVDRLIELFGPFLDDGPTLDSIALALTLRKEFAAPATGAASAEPN